MWQHGPMTTYSTTEVCKALGVSYRMLDYWVRNGMVRVEKDAKGSGSRRRWTLEEVQTLQRVVKRYQAAQNTLEEMRTGELWQQEASASLQPA